MMQLQKDCRKPCSSVGVLSFSLHNIQNSAHKQPAGGGGERSCAAGGRTGKGLGTAWRSFARAWQIMQQCRLRLLFHTTYGTAHDQGQGGHMGLQYIRSRVY
jgi:hypothetical protein